MLQYFSTIQSLQAEPTPTVNFNGKWRNDLRSEMDLNVDAAGAVTGIYRTAVGSPGNKEEFPLAGFATGDLLSFTVNFGKYGSLTSWAGQHTVEGGAEKIRTMWLLARNVVESKEEKEMWGAILTGADTFRR